MLVRSLNPKYSKKYLKQSNNKKPLPDTWSEFAPLTKIRSGSGIVPFNFYSYQKTLVEQIENHSTTVITKSRQLGLTELILNYFLFHACKNPGYLAVVFSKCQADTSNLAKRVRRQLESLIDYAEPETNSVTDIQILNGGRILFRNSTPNGSRGLESVSHILFDEASFVDDIEEIYKSAIPCTTAVGKDAKIIILSTPNGQSGWYWDKLTNNNGDRDILQICEDIKTEKIAPTQYWTDENGWLKFITHWLAHPKYSQEKETYLKQIQQQFELPMEVVEQEYNLSFTSSATNVFDVATVKNAAMGSYREFEEDAIYYMGLDSSSLASANGDYTVLAVLQEIDNVYHFVKMYRRRNQSSQIYMYQASELIEQYDPIKVAIETNGGGQLFLDSLQAQNTSIQFQAIKTTSVSKPLMIRKLNYALEKGLLILPDDRVVIEEFLSFRQNGQKMEAQSGKNDDIVMSLAFAVDSLPIW